MRLRIVIVDDEPLARERLRQLLESEPETEIVAECATGTEAVQVILEKSPDLVFLDVQMPELDGLGVLRSLQGRRSPAVIFVTAHHQYAIGAFEANAVDYLLKPFDRLRFREALGRARAVVHGGARHEALKHVLQTIENAKASPHQVERLVVKSSGRIVFVKIAEIDWIGSADNYVELHVGKEVHLLRETIANLEQQLPPSQFLRISRSIIVNLDRIELLAPRTHGDYLVKLRNGTELTASRRYRAVVKRLAGRKC